MARIHQKSEMKTWVLALSAFFCLLGVFGLFVFVLFVILSAPSPYQSTRGSQRTELFAGLTSGRYKEIDVDVKGVKLVIVGFRHGHRNPTQFLKNDTTHQKWAWEGVSQITTIGKRQSYSFGKYLQQRYGGLIGPEYQSDQIKAYTAIDEPCQMTLQTVMAGLFKPRGRSEWKSGLAWQPIPYEINDPLLGMHNVQCPKYKQVYQSISHDITPQAMDWLTREADLIDYVANKSGLNSSLSDLADVSDNLATMRLRGFPLPKWVAEPNLAGYPPKDMYKDIMQFAEAHQVMCADDPPCAWMMAGLWVDQIVDILLKKSIGKLDTRHGHFYAAQSDTVMSLIRLLKAEGVKETPVSAGFILEYVDEPKPAVRFLYHEDNMERRVVQVKTLAYCSGQEWCPVETLVNSLRNDGSPIGTKRVDCQNVLDSEQRRSSSLD